ncbi:hypothetical protein [Streptomyces sp. NPDC057854]
MGVTLAGTAAADPGWGRPAPEPTVLPTAEPSPTAEQLADPGWG